ncbi:MAG: fluoride efflux transporter CrcB [Nitrospirae bacterium]|nr:fluoride efflux transporter CrcB [Nitrospirota bacterium]
MRFLFIAVGGAIGTLLRYTIAGLIYRLFDSVFPWGTLGVNLLGSFIAGFLWEGFERTTVSPDLRTFIFIGILGSFTTFSSYNLESFNLLRDGEIRLALSNILASNIFGIALVFFGFAASRYLIGFFR